MREGFDVDGNHFFFLNPWLLGWSLAYRNSEDLSLNLFFPRRLYSSISPAWESPLICSHCCWSPSWLIPLIKSNSKNSSSWCWRLSNPCFRCLLSCVGVGGCDVRVKRWGKSFSLVSFRDNRIKCKKRRRKSELNRNYNEKGKIVSLLSIFCDGTAETFLCLAVKIETWQTCARRGVMMNK